ncbi:methyltransferase domain-containing protein [Nitrospiraceae bacterium AH_259_D15_M11_P09]|nr:methyltransferase domain-containing protein [Nitrospiraceae bacterium AH_259_D15_M11_P09]
MMVRSAFSKLGRSALYHLYFFQAIGWQVYGLNLGSGGCPINGFWNIDCRPFSACDVVAGARSIKLASGSVDVIYASHIFEHFPRRRARKVLAEWYRILKPGGPLYLCVPDLEALFKVYLHYLPHFMTEDGRFCVDLACGILFGGQGNRYDYHHSGYSFMSLKVLLLSVGFGHVQRYDPHQLKFAPRDASYAEIRGEPVSLNVEATK